MGAGERSLQTRGGRGVTASGRRLFVEMVPFSGEFLVCLVGAAGLLHRSTPQLYHVAVFASALNMKSMIVDFTEENNSPEVQVATRESSAVRFMVLEEQRGQMRGVKSVWL